MMPANWDGYFQLIGEPVCEMDGEALVSRFVDWTFGVEPVRARHD